MTNPELVRSVQHGVQTLKVIQHYWLGGIILWAEMLAGYD